MGGYGITGTVSTKGNLSCSLASSALSGNLTISGSIPSYPGETHVFPSDDVQIVPCHGWFMADDITIYPVPSNYGKIEWNGVTLTVS